MCRFSWPREIRFPPRVVATDPNTDLAVIRVDLGPICPPRSSLPKPSRRRARRRARQSLGFENTVTAGIVSAVHRNLDQNGPYIDLISTDAPIPRKMGGALVNAAGQVIGINSAGIPSTSNANSLGFAIPSPSARSWVSSSTTGQAGRVPGRRRGRHFGHREAAGIETAECDPRRQRDRARPRISSRSLRSRAPGDEITIAVVRNGEQLELHMRRSAIGRTPPRPATSRKTRPVRETRYSSPASSSPNMASVVPSSSSMPHLVRSVGRRSRPARCSSRRRSSRPRAARTWRPR